MTKIHEDYARLYPMKVIKEELGGWYFYKCPNLTCNKEIKSEYEYCPYCGQKLEFDSD